jgi:hypothetical protein
MTYNIPAKSFPSPVRILIQNREHHNQNHRYELKVFYSTY